MAEIGDIAQVVTYSTNQFQQCLNTYFYRMMDAPSPEWADGLNAEFLETVLPPILPLQHVAVVYSKMVITNIFDTGEQYEYAMTETGSQSGADTGMLPPFMATRARLIRENARVRSGSKFFTGLIESNVTGTNLTFTNPQFAALEAGLSATLTAGVGVDEFRPVIVKRVLYVPSGGTEEAYRLPESQAEMGDNWSYVREAQAQRLVTTMNSRKVGRGS